MRALIIVHCYCHELSWDCVTVRITLRDRNQVDCLWPTMKDAGKWCQVCPLTSSTCACVCCSLRLLPDIPAEPEPSAPGADLWHRKRKPSYISNVIEKKYLTVRLAGKSRKSKEKSTGAASIYFFKWISPSKIYSLLVLMWFRLCIVSWFSQKASVTIVDTNVLLCYSNRNLVWQTACDILMPPSGILTT